MWHVRSRSVKNSHGNSSKVSIKRSQSRLLELVETSVEPNSPYFLDGITGAQRGKMMVLRFTWQVSGRTLSHILGPDSMSFPRHVPL